MEKFPSSAESSPQDQTLDTFTPDNPEVVDQFTKQVASLSDAKRALLALRLATKLGETKSKIPRLPRRDSIPLSPSQEALWFLDQLEPNAIHYNEPVAFRLRGVLNLEALQKAIDQIIARHEVLRTTFTAVDGVPLQVISAGRSVELAMTDLSQLPSDEREGKIQELLKRETRRPFNLSSDLMLRVILLKVGLEEHVLALVMHHIASDGWSINVLYREFSILYGAFLEDRSPPLPALAIQYADFAMWQREWFQREVLDRQLSYWKKQLEGIPGILNLSTDHSRPAVQSYRGASQAIELSKNLTECLKALSRKEGVTLFMTLLAAFQTLLYRYTGQEDIVVGSPIANRNRSEVEGLIGFFANTVVLRTKFDGDPTFNELLGRVRETALGAYAHQDLPFEKLVQELKPERSLGHSPFFQVMFVLQNAPTISLDFPGLRTSRVPISAETAKFDLTLSIGETGNGLSGSIQYSTDLFDAATIARMGGHLKTLLEGIATNPDERICGLPILTDVEEDQLLIDWNATQKDYPKDKCIHELFEEQVEKSPDALAVTFESQQLTYRELNNRANQLAHYLQMLGVGPETVVGICVNRSLEMVVGLLGILKSGGAYLPLDPNYPKERLAFMLEDAQTSLLLTEDRLRHNMPGYRGQTVCLDGDSQNISRQKTDNLDRGVTLQDLAYVIYTSGSTGEPKGAMIEHMSLVNYLCWINSGFFGATVQNLPLITNLNFDASLKQLFAPLLSGKDVWILSGEAVSQPALLISELSTRTGVGLNCVPSLWKVIVDAIQFGHTVAPKESLSALFLGGEQISQELIDKTLIALPNLTIWNLYGVTEATANSVFGKISTGGKITIGRPTANTQVYVLDPYLSPVPIGVTGELYIGGEGLARGYVNRAELTAERFFPNPFSKEPGGRLYRTGDLARYLPDGNVEFLGRVDHQVKIRGFRIELREVEATLSRHSGVRETVVMAWEDAGNPKSETCAKLNRGIESRESDRRLVAYIVSADKQSHTSDELRNFLKQKLPEYMVPAVFVFLNTLPLTQNGKIDRKALPRPEGRPDMEQGYVVPRSPVEEILAGIWARVLKLDKVGIHDNFFELGGHSLLATQVISQVRHILQAEVALRSLFAMPTIAQLANEIEAGRQRYSDALAPKILPIPRRLRPVNL